MLSYFKLLIVIMLSFIVQMIGVERAVAADEIHRVAFCQYKDSNYLVVHLFNFHITEGNYEKGSVTANGYNTSKLMVINLNSQKVLCLKDYGAYDSEGAFEVLGCSDSLIWIYSKKYKSGLQALNLFTLKVEITQARIYNQMQGWTGRFFDPLWNEINQFYRFLPLQNQMLISNYNKQQFVIELADFVTQSVNEPFEPITNEWKSYSKIIESPYDTIHLYGYNIFENGNAIIPDRQFIDGAFMVDQSPEHLYQYYLTMLNQSQQKIDGLMDVITRIRVRKGSEEFEQMNQELKRYETANKEAQRNMDALLKGEKSDLVMLRPNSTGIFVISAENKNADARLLITRIDQINNIYQIRWKCPLTGMFFDLSKAKDTKEFKRYFEDELPDSKFIRFEVMDTSLIVIYLMQVAVVDLETGEIVWRLKL